MRRIRACAAQPESVPADGGTEAEEWKLLRDMRRAVHDYELIAPGDKICVAVSGGKDSSTLAYLLQQLKTRRLLPFDDWSFLTVHLDQVQPGHDPSSLVEWLDGEGIESHLIREDTYSVVTEKTKPGASYCSLCSRLRRGILYTAADNLGCNRLALGHHRDDALETLLLNMVHQGQTKALPARYVASRGLDVIRPLSYIAEDDIGAFAKARGFPILPCNLCGSQPDGTPGQRKQMKLLLAALDGLGDGQARVNMLRSLSDVRPTHLLDRQLRIACGLDGASGALRWERGRAVSHGDPSEMAIDEPPPADADEHLATVDSAATAPSSSSAPTSDAAVAPLAAPAAASGEEARPAATAGVPSPQAGTQRAPEAGAADARRSRFRATTGPHLFTAPSAAAYEAGAAQLVNEGDGVLEIGCQLGTMTAALAARAGFVIGVDMERELHGKSGKAAHYRQHATPSEAGLDAEIVDLALLDPWDTPALLHAVGGRKVDVLAMDINSHLGHDLPLAPLALARQLSRLLPSLKAILIKSRSLTKLQRQLILPGAYAQEDAETPPPAGWMPRLIPTVGVKEYRAAALEWLSRHPTATVLEIGCHLGTSTAQLDAELATFHEGVGGDGAPRGFCAGVDCSRSIIERAKALHPGVHFDVADAWDATQLRAAWAGACAAAEGGATHQEDPAAAAQVDPATSGPQLVMLDVGGVSSAQGELDALALLQMLTTTFGASIEALVVKSHCLRSTARTLKPIKWGTPAASKQKAAAGPGDAPASGRGDDSAAAAAATAVAPQSRESRASSSSPGVAPPSLASADSEPVVPSSPPPPPKKSREAARAQHLPGSEPPTRERLQEALSQRHAGVCLVVENCRKGNVASIARTAECLGVGELHLIFTPDQIVNTRGFGGMPEEKRSTWLSKLSKSATDWLVIEQHDSLDACVSALRGNGVDTMFVATSPLEDGAVPLYGGDGAWARARHVALLFGSEGAGLSPAALALADVKLCVPMAGMTQSLNVAACAAIVLAETLRLRSLPAPAEQQPEEGADEQLAGPPRLSEEAQRALEERMMPMDGGPPLRLHNKARAKHAMREVRLKVRKEAAKKREAAAGGS